MQALDIHFPLQSISTQQRPRTSKGRKLFLIEPDKKIIGENDTVKVKVLFHRLHQEHGVFLGALKNRNIMPAIWFELATMKFVTIAFQYSKQMPISIPKDDGNRFGAMCQEICKKSGRKVGDSVLGMELLMFRMGRLPLVYNIGGFSIYWKAEKHFSINTGPHLPNCSAKVSP
jgi:hypothetical protein